MSNVLEAASFEVISAKITPEEPRGVFITLRVSATRHVITVDGKKLTRIGRILDLTADQLISSIAYTVQSGKVQDIAYYRSSDIADSKLQQLNGLIPFIEQTVHCFGKREP